MDPWARSIAGNENADSLAKNITQTQIRPTSSYSAKTHVHKSTRFIAHHQLPLITSGKNVRSVPDSPRGMAVAGVRLITGHDCHLYRIGIKTSPLSTPCNEDEVTDKRHLGLCPPLTKGTLSDRYWKTGSRIS